MKCMNNKLVLIFSSLPHNFIYLLALEACRMCAQLGQAAQINVRGLKTKNPVWIIVSVVIGRVYCVKGLRTYELCYRQHVSL